jgi:hypothetical protein
MRVMLHLVEIGDGARQCEYRSRVGPFSHFVSISFNTAPKVASNLIEFKKVTSWRQGSFIEKVGWATMPGGEPANAAVAQACATMLSRLQN